jgi:hypothetical protein
VEDCPEWGIDRLQSFGLSPVDTASLIAITHQPNESRATYMDRVCADRCASEVKLRDLQDNLSPERLEGLDAATQQRLVAKYLVATDRVTKAIWRHTTGPAVELMNQGRMA